MNNVMLDLETWGKRPGCALRSIGAVMFDPFSRAVGQTFYRNVTRESCVALGLHVDQSTVDWWNKPENARAQSTLDEAQVDVRAACEDLVRWVRRCAGVFVWGQGANFDPPIIEEALRLLEIQPPWRFYHVRDTRTLYEAAGLGPRDMPTRDRNAPAHNALYDATHQARCVQEAYRHIRTASAALGAQEGER